LEEFCRELERRTDGRVKVDYFAGGSLLGAPAMFEGITTGVADIGFSHVYYTPSRMPVTEGAGLPLGYPSAWLRSLLGQGCPLLAPNQSNICLIFITDYTF